MMTTAYYLASRFLGLKETPGAKSHPAVLAMLQHAGKWPQDDSVPWCSAFVFTIAWLLDLPRPQSAALAARSWITVGRDVPLGEAEPGFDVVVLARGTSPASGHVGFYAGHSESTVLLLGGNQSDAVTIQAFDKARIVSVRRLWEKR